MPLRPARSPRRFIALRSSAAATFVTAPGSVTASSSCAPTPPGARLPVLPKLLAGRVGPVPEGPSLQDHPAQPLCAYTCMSCKRCCSRVADLCAPCRVVGRACLQRPPLPSPVPLGACVLRRLLSRSQVPPCEWKQLGRSAPPAPPACPAPRARRGLLPLAAACAAAATAGGWSCQAGNGENVLQRSARPLSRRCPTLSRPCAVPCAAPWGGPSEGPGSGAGASRVVGRGKGAGGADGKRIAAQPAARQAAPGRCQAL